MGKLMPKYNLGPMEFGESDRFGCWASQELETFGDTLDELIENAAYTFTDQDGGELGSSEPADDKEAVAFITDWYNEQVAKEKDTKSSSKFDIALAKFLASHGIAVQDIKVIFSKPLKKVKYE